MDIYKDRLNPRFVVSTFGIDEIKDLLRSSVISRHVSLKYSYHLLSTLTRILMSCLYTYDFQIELIYVRIFIECLINKFVIDSFVCV